MMRESTAIHAMTITGVDQQSADQPHIIKWRVENSWGDDSGRKGFVCMEDEWFDEYVFEVVVPLPAVPAFIMDRAMRQPPIPLSLWDPMGSVARAK